MLSESPVKPRVLIFPNVSKINPKLRSPTLEAKSSENQSPGGSESSTGIHLVPKTVAKLAACGRQALLGMVDPKPEWSLHELKTELNALESRLVCAQMDETPTKQRWTLDKDVAHLKKPSFVMSLALDKEVVDFKKTGFAMKLDDDESNDDDSEEEENDNQSELSEHDSESSTYTECGPACDLPPASFEEVLPGQVDAALYEVERLRQARVQVEFRQKRSELEAALLEERQKSAEKISQVLKSEEVRCEMTRRSDMQFRLEAAEQRDRHLYNLQQDHERRSQIEERKIKSEEKALRTAKEERERELRAKMEAEAAESEQRARAEAQKAEAVRKAAAEAQKREEERKEKELAAKKRSEQGPPTKIAKGAAEAEAMRKRMFQELQNASQMLLANRKELKTLGLQVTKILLQVSATEEQVRKKSMELLHLLSVEHNRSYIIVTLAEKLMAQCENQIVKVPSYGFIFARIIFEVSRHVPVVMDAVLAALNARCIYTVPKHFVYNKTDYEDDKNYFKTLGYREDENGKFETEDMFVERMASYITLYAAIVQTEGNIVHGISEGWKWCARLLNHLPANRCTAAALFAFFETAGFRLYQTYPRPFQQLMQAVVSKFVPLLQKKNDPDTRAVLNRLETYLVTQKYLQRPDSQLYQREVFSTTVMK